MESTPYCREVSFAERVALNVTVPRNVASFQTLLFSTTTRVPRKLTFSAPIRNSIKTCTLVRWTLAHEGTWHRKKQLYSLLQVYEGMTPGKAWDPVLNGALKTSGRNTSRHNIEDLVGLSCRG